ncbi:MAG TPA: hypothetical protein VHV08_10180 [Pirellulales bacterium]|jgi:hypothetical protein|nr:hypothetical protein [Pirellulales bacterium]
MRHFARVEVAALSVLAAALVVMIPLDSRAWAQTPADAEQNVVLEPAARGGDDPFSGTSDPPAAKPAEVSTKPPADGDCTAQSEARIRAALREPTVLNFTDTPLSDALDYLKDKHGIEIQLDSKALEEAGVGADTPITRSVNNVSLRSGLRLLLSPVELTAVVTDGVLLITTSEAAAEMVEVRVYNVSDLLDDDDDIDDFVTTLSALLIPPVRFPQVVTSPTTAGMGGGSVGATMRRSESAVTITRYHKLLLVRAPMGVQDAVARLLNEIRQKLKEQD